MVEAAHDKQECAPEVGMAASAQGLGQRAQALGRVKALIAFAGFATGAFGFLRVVAGQFGQ
ncbi:MAG: hypothetical protein NTX50_27515 [Candidatus Sumerlaeota bacterium]|nr:hypothetical protein [Candidatus Sumerlaeota bacterium]